MVLSANQNPVKTRPNTTKPRQTLGKSEMKLLKIWEVRSDEIEYSTT